MAQDEDIESDYLNEKYPGLFALASAGTHPGMKPYTGDIPEISRLQDVLQAYRQSHALAEKKIELLKNV